MQAAAPAAAVATAEAPASRGMLWSDKYKPQTVSQMCYPVCANKLRAWLENFEPAGTGDLKKPRAVLLSGPPGVGKTTTVHVVAKELGRTVVEYNASDFRSRKSLREYVSTLTTNRAFAATAQSYTNVVLLMDEVDGCDIGGVGEVIEMIKKTSIPILCTCNDRWHPKLRSLMNHVEDIRFSRPPCNLVATYLCDRVLAREGITLSKPLLQDIIKRSGSDIRNMLNNLQLWCINRQTLEQRQLAECAVRSEKNGDVGLFDSAEYFLLQGTTHGERHSIKDMETTYYNSDLIDMFVQENYLHFSPPERDWMDAVADAASCISRSDSAQRMMYLEQNWSVSRAYVLLSSIAPVVHTRGKYQSFLEGQQSFFDRQRPVKFPSWLGNNSTTGKNKRLLRCVAAQAQTVSSGNQEDVVLDYIPIGWERPLLPIHKYYTHYRKKKMTANNKAAKKKGMSMEDKIEKVEQWFLRHPEPYTLKELIALIPRATGVIFQSVEECVELLISEGRVLQEKVGVHTLMWRFSCTEAQLKAQASAAPSMRRGGGSSSSSSLKADYMALTLEALQDRAEEQQRHLRGLEAAITQRAELVGSADMVASDTQRTLALHQKRAELCAQLQSLASYDPNMTASLRRSAVMALDAANRWTDNYFLLEQQIAERTGQSCKELRASLGLAAQLDFIEAEEVGLASNDNTEKSSRVVDDGPACQSRNAAKNHISSISVVTYMAPASGDVTAAASGATQHQEEGKKSSTSPPSASTPISEDSHIPVKSEEDNKDDEVTVDVRPGSVDDNAAAVSASVLQEAGLVAASSMLEGQTEAADVPPPPRITKPAAISRRRGRAVANKKASETNPPLPEEEAVAGTSRESALLPEAADASPARKRAKVAKKAPVRGKAAR